MKSSTKGLVAGLVAVAFLLAAVGIFGVIGLGRLLSSPTASQWLSDLMLATPQFPSVNSLPELGRVEYDWLLYDLDGRSVRFSEFEGKTVFVNVWATWCPPCVMELPSIEKLHRSVDRSDVAFVIVSREDGAIVKEFVDRQPLDLPLYVTDSLPRELDGRSIPATFVLDERGVVVFRHLGPAQWGAEACREFLTGMAEASAGDSGRS